MVILMSILIFVMVASLLYFFGVKFWVSQKTAVDRVLGYDGPSTEAPRSNALAFKEILQKVGDLVPTSPADLSLVGKRLYQAGFRNPGAVKLFYGVKVMATIGLPLTVWLTLSQFGITGDSQMGLIVLSAGLGFMGPNEVLNFLIKRRRKKIEKALPNALDLLVVCVESGLGLDQGIVQVSRELQVSYPEISGEFAVTNLEMRHGKRRADALRNLGDRTGVDDMKKLVSTLIQADRFGTSIAQTLRTHSDFMRLTARQRAEEKAAKLGIKLVFPIFFCILPSLFVVTVGPIIVKIMFDLLPTMNNAGS